MDENKVNANPPADEAQPPKEGGPTPEVFDHPSEGGPEAHEKEPIHWATKKERVIAWVLAIIVILITLAYAYSIATGDLFRH